MLNNINIEKFKIYEQMYLIRRFEEKLHESLKCTDISRYNHLSIGREAINVAMSKIFKENDKMVNTYRTHGLALAFGMSPVKLLNKILMNDDLENGSMYVNSSEIGMVSSNTIIGAGLPISLGLAFDSKFDKKNNVIWCLFGDGAATGGTIHECMNIASKHNLKIIFLCENNGIAMCTPVESVASFDKVSDLGKEKGRLSRH
ncbi:thiamine pyrophosphate-dependent enzyme [Exiguobacterium sp. S3]|uniref:thiamine pyrophosphate-dependent enzyme n=1 Tax=Exiguobacterium sp. S3 TaxID=483245 RepID=UPI001BE63DA8|nr:thiamine pyrophosphate-dependent enzyme [Exiguobacterium sp. S3]